MGERANLDSVLRFGVKCLSGQLGQMGEDGSWDPDGLRKVKDNCDRAGVDLEAIRMDSAYITLRKGPERDRRLAAIVENIRKASKVGVRVITNHWCVILIRRNTAAKGRGGSTLVAFQHEDNCQSLPMRKSRRV